MIIAGAPTAKVCLSSLFFWIPGRGSVLINAHHVFFSMLVFRYLRLFFLFFLFYLRFWNMSVGRGVWCDISMSRYCFRFDIFMRCVPGSVVAVCFLCASGEWSVTRCHGSSIVLAHRLLMLFMCVDGIKWLETWQLSSSSAVSSLHYHDPFLIEQSSKDEDVIFFQDQTA